MLHVMHVIIFYESSNSNWIIVIFYGVILILKLWQAVVFCVECNVFILTIFTHNV